MQNIFQGYMEGTTNAAGGQVGTGSGFDSRNTGNNYTIDGATNNGFGRRIASSPNSDQIEEMRVETSNFDASQGYGTGLTVSMMTRGGTNTLRGSANYTHWNNELNSPNLQQKVAFKQDPRQEDALRSGKSHIGAFTLGGPIVVPKVFNGRRKCVLLRELREVERLGAGAPRRQLHRAGQPRSTSKAISPTCCCCRRAPGPPRPPATTSTKSTIP